MKDKPEIIQRNPADLIPYARNAKLQEGASHES
jgi:hypothetical protein